MTFLRFAMAAALVASAAAATCSARGSAPAAGHIDLATARRIALKARPGKVAGEELEKERGGSGLRYSFDITDHGRSYEVGVDARTGAVLENAAEGPKHD